MAERRSGSRAGQGRHHDEDAGESAAVKPDATPAELLLAVTNGAVRLLARREHGRTELRNKLLLRDHPVGMIDDVLEQLAQQGLQSDQRFAEAYTRARTGRGYGSNKIRAELMSRDVDRDIIDAALANTDECWVENAVAALSKKYSNPVIAIGDLRQQAKMQRFLWSRGYNSEQIKLAIEHLTNP